MTDSTWGNQGGLLRGGCDWAMTEHHTVFSWTDCVLWKSGVPLTVTQCKPAQLYMAALLSGSWLLVAREICLSCLSLGNQVIHWLLKGRSLGASRQGLTWELRQRCQGLVSLSPSLGSAWLSSLHELGKMAVGSLDIQPPSKTGLSKGILFLLETT